MKSELQKLLQRRLDDLVERHKNVRVQREQLDGQLENLSRDMAAMREALNVEMRATGQATEQHPSNGTGLHGLKLGEAVRALQKENPKISKEEIRQRLDEIAFDFRGKRPGTAIHMALVQMARHKSDGL